MPLAQSAEGLRRQSCFYHLFLDLHGVPHGCHALFHVLDHSRIEHPYPNPHRLRANALDHQAVR